MKKLITMALVFTLLLNLFNVNIIEASEDENLEYAQKLKKVGVFVGSDEGFELERPATRLEGIIMLIRLLGEEENALETYYDIPFIDVPDWAFGYVSYAYNYGLSNGVSDTEFGSSNELTNMQYFTFMARALGYDDSEGDFTWDNSISFMNSLDFVTTEEQAMYEGKSLLRSDVAKLSYDLMTQPIKDSSVVLAKKLIVSGDLDTDIAIEIGVYTPIVTDRAASEIVNENNLLDTYDTINIERSVEEGYPSPFAVPVTVSATSNPTDIITFTEGLSGQALFDSLEHKGFEGVTATYEVKDITWYDFFDSISISESPTTITAKLKGEFIYENEIEDQYEQYFRYYNPETTAAYTVNEVYYGDYSEPIENLTFDRSGNIVYMLPFEKNDHISYNPIILKSIETLLYITFTAYEDETVLYLEKKGVTSFTKQWISLKDGLTVQEYVFDGDGVIQDMTNKESFVYETIDDSIFVQPDIEYYDLTLLMHVLTYDNLLNFQEALMATYSESPFSFELVDDGAVQYEVIVNGYEGGDSFDEFGYISHRTDSLGNDIELRQFYDGSLFHTVTPVFEMDEVFEGSIERLIMFDFNALGFRNHIVDGNMETLTFEDPTYAGVRGSRQFYDYIINTDTDMIESITAYAKDSPTDTERYDETLYSLENFVIFDASNPYDPTLFVVPASYDVIERPGEVYYDGEHAHQWYYKNEFGTD